MFTLGGNNNKFYGTYKSRAGKQLEIRSLVSCEIDTKKPVNFYIKSEGSQIYVTYHYDNETEYRKCMEITFPRHQFKNFFVSLFARSSAESKLAYDLTSMTFSSDAENIGVTEFEAKFDENIPKLFKQISYYKTNQDTLKTRHPTAQSDNLDIPSIHNVQSQVLNMVDYSNTQISRSIEESGLILSYIESQDESTKELGDKLLGSLNRWLTNTQKQYKIMDRDVGKIVAEIEKFSFDKLLVTTQELLGNLNTRLEETTSDFKEFRKFNKLIRKNLDVLRYKKEELYDFPKALKKLRKSKTLNKSDSMQTVLTLLLAFLGFTIIAALLSILFKLTAGQKRDILG